MFQFDTLSSLTYSVGEFSVALGALFEFDNELDEHPLLHHYTLDFCSDRDSNLQSHGIGFGPHPNGIGQVEFGTGVAGQRRNALEAYSQQLWAFEFRVDVVLFCPLKPTTLPALVDDNVVRSALAPLQNALEIDFLGQTDIALVGSVWENHCPTQTTRDLIHTARTDSHDWITQNSKQPLVKRCKKSELVMNSLV